MSMTVLLKLITSASAPVDTVIKGDFGFVC